MYSVEPPPQSLLEWTDILQAICNFSFHFDENPNVITKEQSLVVKDIEKVVRDDEGVASRIIEGLAEIFANETYLKKALLPSALKKEGVTFVIEQESLIRLLLRVNQLQDDVFKLLLEQLVKVCSVTEDCSELRLLLSPLKYLPNINNAKYFSQKLLDILEICTPELQLEMLDVIPDIIPDSCYNTVAEQLLTILNEENSPWDAIIECFGAFDFDDNVKEYMYGRLMNLIVPVHPQCLPATIKLLFNTHKGKIPLEIFSRIRDIINCEMKKSDNTTLKSDIVNALRTVSNKRQFIQSCLDVISSVKTPRDHITFDMFVMLMLVEDPKFKEIIRKKVETGFFTGDLIKNTLKNTYYYEALTTLHDSSNLLLKLSSFLLRFSSVKVENFTLSLFDSILRGNTKGEKFRMIAKEIVECIVRGCNNSDPKCVHQTLRIFFNLVKNCPEQFYDHLNKVMGLLKKMDDFDLHAASMVYQIICHIQHVLDHKNPQSEVIENEIHMMIRKQLMSSKRMKKSKGIMGAIKLLQNYIVCDMPTGENDYSDSVEDSECVQEPLPESILTLIESVFVLTGGFSECTGLFYDELASMVEKNHIRRNFVDWMIEKIRLSLHVYISTSKDQMSMVNNLAYLPRYGAVISGKSHTLRIGLMAAEPQKYENKPLILLPPLFRLYRTLLTKTIIDPMDSEDFMSFVSSSFILPTLDKFEDLHNDQLKQLADALYHTMNYLKEVVDSTITKTIHEDLFLDRFQLLTKLEGFFNEVLSKIPEHTFPNPYFQDPLKCKQMHELKKKCTVKTGKKRKITHDDTIASTSVLSINELNTSSSPVLTSKKNSVPNRQSKCQTENNILFRQINVCSLFNMIQFSTKKNSADVAISYCLLVFILRDVVRELKAIVQEQTGKIQSKIPVDVLKNILKELPKVTVSFTELVKEMESLDVVDDESDQCEMILCFSYFLELFYIILRIPPDDSCELMHEICQALDVDRKKSENPDETSKKLIRVYSDNLKVSIILSHGVLTYQIIERIMQFQPKNNRNIKIALCENILFKRWLHSKQLPYSEKQMNQDTKFILEKYFRELKVENLHEVLSKVAMEYADLKKKTDNLPSLPIINYSNFHILFISLCNALHENVDKEIQQRLSNLDHLKLWKNTTSFMFILMGIAKNVHIRNNMLLCTFLRKSIPILKIFIAQALPIFDIMFSSKTEAVVDILKSMQASTRFIHQLCCQSKMFKNFSVISHIPGFRLVLEQLIYKVKALLVSHKCEEAFFLGNLKNKDIHGNTQTSEILDEDITQENEQDGDEDMVEDDSEVLMEDDRSESLTF